MCDYLYPQTAEKIRKNVRPFVRRVQQNGWGRYETKPPDHTSKTGGAGMRRMSPLTPRAG